MPFLKSVGVLILALMVLSLSACDFIASFTGEEKNTSSPSSEDEGVEFTQLTLAVAPQMAWMPWFLAAEEGVLNEHATRHKINVQFISDNYRDTIEKFVNEEVNAIAINNIDAIAQLVRRDIEADIILITNYNTGSEAILVPTSADTNVRSLRGRTFALVEYSSRHYLLDRYLIRNQISFEEVNIRDTTEVDIPNIFINKEVYSVVSANPNVYKLVSEEDAKVLFSSREIPKELFDLLVVRRDTLRDHPNFAQVLLATWFSIMERLQGNKKGPTLDAMARLANLTRDEYDQQLVTTPLNDTSTKALSAIRDRRIRKTMRHIRYFIERHELTGNEVFTGWVSYPGRTPALLHFNGQPLQEFVIPHSTHQLNDSTY